MATRRQRSRVTRLLIDLAWERFYGCEVCWRSDAFDSIEDVLEPLRLKGRELRRLFRRLACPRCESRCRPGTYVVAANEEQIRHSMLARKFDRSYGLALGAFRSFLVRHPMLGVQHPFGRVLSRAVTRASRISLQPSIWYRATRELKRPAFEPCERRQVARAHRFNQIGQVAWYLGSDDKTAAVEVLRAPCPGVPFCVAKIEILEPLGVLDLCFGTWGEDRSGHWILRNVVDRRFVSEPTDDIDESRPQYRIPQFVADLAQKQGFRGILYDSSRPSAYNNPEAVGRNLVVFDPIPRYRILSEAKMEFSEADYDPWSLERWCLRPIVAFNGDDAY